VKQPRYHAGFILSLEAVLLFCLLGIGLLVGVVVLRDVLVKYYLSRQDDRFLIADSSEPPKLIGNAVGFDEHDAPQVIFVDYHDADTNPLPNGFNFRTLIGVRDDRFTSRQPVFYATPNCSAAPVCIARPGSEQAHSLIASLTGTTGSISYLNALQGNGPSYAVGRDLSVSAAQDLLYRSSATQCDVELLSMWVSQTLAVTSTDSCVNIPEGQVSGAELSAFLQAQPVLIPGSSNNVFQGLIPPYFTNMIDNPLVELTRFAPTGEGL
jgi:hypothetical protein